jgi:putative NIF3 family GTP cyclohydrolase 1 type 2
MSEQITAQQVVDRIQKNLGVPWKTPGLDGFAAGSPDTRVTGIVTTFTPTLEVLRRAVATQKNMIVSREPVFYTDPRYRGGPAATNEDLAKDPTLRFKRAFITENNLVVWRFFENWNARETDGQLRALAAALGWEKYYQPGAGEELYQRGNEFFVLPSTSLGALAKNVRDRLKSHGIRVIGDPQTRVSKCALTHGFLLVPELATVLKEPAVDVVMCGEPVEWEAGPYFMDVVASGQKKGMIVVGHEVSEEPGSGEVAAWLKTFVPEVPVEWIPAGDPFWALT